ncbi:MAG: GAF domain-containing protein [Candidatus Latescibacteria bacterium]|nr:GAF domain-containing protein [Candidatus Latescibacterota bacterium]
MVRIYCLPDEREFEIKTEVTILDAALQADTPFTCECGGGGDCCTCRVLVLEGLEHCTPRTEQEQERATALDFPPNVRLACQTRVTGDVTVRRLVIQDMKQGTSDTNETPTPPILERHHRHLSILNTIAGELNRSVDLRQALQTVLAQVATLLDLETGWIFLLDRDTEDSYLAALQNLPPALADNPQLLEGSCYCLDSYRNGSLKGAANVNVITCSRLHKLTEGTEGLRFHASIPLYAHDRKLGILNVASRNWRGLSDDDLRLLNTIGDLLSIALERAHLFEQSIHMGVLEERYRLARELHDTLGQGLAAIVMKLDALDAVIEANTAHEQIHDQLHYILELARANLEEGRRAMLDLRAAPLEGYSLAEALTRLTNTIATEYPIRVSCSTRGDNHPLPIRIQSGLFRIAQEALNNIVQHAQACQVSVQLVTMPGHVHLTIRDDGCGFDPSMLPPNHYGLIGIHERAKLLEGKVEIESRPEQGTTLDVSIPLRATHGDAHPHHDRR